MDVLLAYLSVLSFLSSSVFSSYKQATFDTADSDPKYVVAHFIVGNTYPYAIEDWTRDMTLAVSKGFDAFALNVGHDYWQPARVADAFAAARNVNGDFKLFMSFDMNSMACSGPSDADALRSYLTTYQFHPNYLMHDGSLLVSTFAGEACQFGASSVNEGWTNAIKNGTPRNHFVPSFFIDPTTFPGLTVMDGSFNWNSAWPMGNYAINNASDKAYTKNLGDRTYMAGVSPWFFTHYGADTYNKNFIYRGDEWLFAERWEMLVQNRLSIDLVQVITWNDFGESHYIGPISGAQPKSEAWTTGFDHQGWLDLAQYYITAFKTGTYPSISRDRVFLWGRLYPVQASAPDSIGRPGNWQFTQDFLWAIVLLTSPAQINISCGPSSIKETLTAGLSKLRLPLVSACSVVVDISRDEMLVLEFSPPGFEFCEDPPSYNFNAYVAVSP